MRFGVPSREVSRPHRRTPVARHRSCNVWNEQRIRARAPSRFWPEAVAAALAATLVELRSLPNLFAARLVLVVILWGFALAGNARVVGLGLALAFVTDAADGFAARRLNRVTPFGSRFDSLVDSVVGPSAIVWLLLLEPDVVRDHALLAGVWVAVTYASLAVGILRHRRFANLHLRSSRVACVAQYAFLVDVFIASSYSPVLLYLAAGLGILVPGDAGAPARLPRDRRGRALHQPRPAASEGSRVRPIACFVTDHVRQLLLVGIASSLALAVALQWDAIETFEWRLSWLPFFGAVCLFSLDRSGEGPRSGSSSGPSPRPLGLVPPSGCGSDRSLLATSLPAP